MELQSVGNRPAPLVNSGGWAVQATLQLQISQEKDIPTQQNAEIGEYVKFESQVKELDEALRKLSNEARSLGRSVSILGASTRLRERLGRVLYLFRQNAQTLFPQQIREHIRRHHTPIKPVRHWRTKNFLDPNDDIQGLSFAVLDKPDGLAKAFRQFSEDVDTLFECFGEYPEFLEELPDRALAEDLRAWAQLLEDNMRWDHQDNAFARLLFESMTEIGVRLEALTKYYIHVFIKIGIPTVKAIQDHSATNLGNQTLVAALFAGVATGMIQVFSSGGSGGGGLNDWIVLLWYMTLIFSVASAVNGLLGLSWMQAIYRSPDSHVPWWVRIWIKRFPLVFLVLAVGCFFVALILFAFIPRQNRETFVVTVILSSASCFGLVVVSLWFSFELIVYTVFGGRKWLSDVFADIHVVSFVARHWELLRSRRNGQTVNDTERACSDDHTLDPGSGLQETAKYCADLIRSGDVPPKFIYKTRSLWQTLLHHILQTRSDSDEHQPAEQPSPWDMLHRVASEIGDTKPQRMSEAILQFKSKGEAIRCLHFSPNGSMLAISCVHKSGNSGRSSASSTVFLSSIRHDQQHEPYALEHPDPNSYIRQIHWAPDGRKFFTRSHYMLGVWQMEGNNWNTPTLVRELPSATVEHRMRSASWRFDGDTGNIIYVEGRRTIIENTSRHLALANCIQYLQFRHLCVKQGTCWMVGAGTYALEDQRLPRRHYIILWKLQSSGKVEYEIIKKIPVVRAISKMMLAESSQKSILVSFENKASSQLWEIEGDDTSAYIAFRHQYDPECDIQCFSDLYSIFGGTADSLVLRATSAGDIHVWHRETAEPMRCIKRPSLVKGEITCLAWNRGSGKYMLATGTKDGAVYIWTEPEKKPSSDESQTAKSAAAGAAFLKPVRGGQNDSKTDTESNNKNVELKETSITVSPAVTPGIEDTYPAELSYL